MPAAAFLVVLCAIGCGSKRKPPLATYDDACATPALRAAYIAGLVDSQSPLPAFVLSVEYVDDETVASRWPAVARAPRMPGMLTIPEPGLGAWTGDGGVRSRIAVFAPSMACGLPGGEAAFRLGLFAHEFEHARIGWEGPASLGVSPAALASIGRQQGAWLLHTLGELQAYRHELEAAATKDMPEEWRRVALGAYLEYYLGLLAPPVPLETNLHNRLLLAWFAPWFLTKVPILLRDDQGLYFDTGDQQLRVPPPVSAAVEHGRNGGIVAP